MERYDVQENPERQEKLVENMSILTISLTKIENIPPAEGNPQPNNQPDFKWFLDNEDELRNSRIILIRFNGEAYELKNNKFEFKFQILDGATNTPAKFSFKDAKNLQGNQNPPKKEITIKIKRSNIYDIDVFFSKREDIESIEVNEISDIDSDKIILEPKKAKKIIIKGNKSDEYSWFIENKNQEQIKNALFFGNLDDPESGRLRFTRHNEENNRGIFEFIIKAYDLPNNLPKLKLIYKKINGYQNEEQNKDKNIIEKNIQIIKKPEISKCKKYINNYNIYAAPIYIINFIIVILSALIIYFATRIEADGTIIDVISEDLINDLEFSFINDISNKSLSKEISYNESNSVDFIFDRWKGTVEGCGKIENNITNVYRLEKGKKCQSGEEYLENIPHIEINNYKGFILSASTPGYTNYHRLLYDGSIIKENEKCPEGKKSCGYIDTLRNLLCIDEKSECPINYIKIDKIPPKNITHLKCINGSQINIYYSNNPYENRAGTPFIQSSFKIGEDKLCTIPNLYYTNINLFKLDAFIKDYAYQCTLKDYSQEVTQLFNYYVPLDTIDNYQLYYDNKIIERINNSNLVKYGFDINKYKNNKLYLYVRTHYGYDKECLEKRRINYDIKVQLNKMNGIGTKMKTWARDMYVSNGVNIFVPLTEFVAIRKFFSDNEALSLPESIIKVLSNLASNLASTILSFRANVFDDPGEEKMNCSDQYVNDNFNVMTQKIRNSGYWIIVCTYISLASCILNFIQLIYKIIYELILQKKNDYNNDKKYKYKIKTLNEELLKRPNEIKANENPE